MPYQGDDLLMPPEFSEMGSTLQDTMADILGWGQFDAVVSLLVLSKYFTIFVADISGLKFNAHWFPRGNLVLRCITILLHTNQLVSSQGVYLIVYNWDVLDRKAPLS